MIIINPSIDIVLWDLDGTLLDSMGVFEEILAEIAPEFGYNAPSHETISKNFHGSLKDSIVHSLGGASEEIAEQIIKKFLHVQDGHYEVVDKHLCPDAVGLAKRLHAAGKKQIVVTNREHEGSLKASPRSIVATSELAQYITQVICGDDSEHRKPNPQVLGELLQAGLLIPEKTLVIGDQFVDGEFALNLRAQAILVSRDTGEITHVDRLVKNWQNSISIVRSLDDVAVI